MKYSQVIALTIQNGKCITYYSLLLLMFASDEDEREIHKSIWTQIVNNLDVDELLKGDRNQLLSLFETTSNEL